MGWRWLLAVVTTSLVVACVEGPEDSAALPPGGLTTEELAAEPPDDQSWQSLGWDVTPVPAQHATNVSLEALAEVGYVDEQGRYVVDLLQQDFAYLAVRVETTEGIPVIGAVPAFSIEGTSQLLEPHDVSPLAATDEYGVVEFAVVGGEMGLDRVKIELGEASTEILVNIISLEAAGFPPLPVVEGGLPWEELMSARIRFQDMVLFADFPETITERAGESVRLSGFMMPLDPDLKQRRFLLTSNPPSCFFHVPGGPAGAVEVIASEGIEVSWDPVVLEGRFEPQRKSEIGVVYRLHDARLVTP